MLSSSLLRLFCVVCCLLLLEQPPPAACCPLACCLLLVGCLLLFLNSLLLFPRVGISWPWRCPWESKMKRVIKYHLLFDKWAMASIDVIKSQILVASLGAQKSARLTVRRPASWACAVLWSNRGAECTLTLALPHGSSLPQIHMQWHRPFSATRTIHLGGKRQASAPSYLGANAKPGNHATYGN